MQENLTEQPKILRVRAWLRETKPLQQSNPESKFPTCKVGPSELPATIAFKDAVLGLIVTPQITPDDRVGMKIAVHNDTVGTIYAGVPQHQYE